MKLVNLYPINKQRRESGRFLTFFQLSPEALNKMGAGIRMLPASGNREDGVFSLSYWRKQKKGIDPFFDK